ncbi:MAG: Asp-tRNA(Asn)/Glu-tRNA(Gln) amidotransferase subunit GatC [Rhodocyclaceae bacterium]|nr:Asp-tRNA(Asn)/Glu-tRNA(Gln) amidotransferase subunit GatC [Rhodocyclaceae bacterium]
MSLTHSEVVRIAHLARIAITPAEAETMRRELERILAFVGELDKADTTGIEPMAHAIDVVQRLRADEITECDRRDEFLALAPDTEAGLYLVPKVIE